MSIKKITFVLVVAAVVTIGLVTGNHSFASPGANADALEERPMPTSTPAGVYEGFDTPATGSLNGQSGCSSFGWSGTWGQGGSSTAAQIITGSLLPPGTSGFYTAPLAPNHARGSFSGQGRRAISGSVPFGSTVWGSFLVDVEVNFNAQAVIIFDSAGSEEITFEASSNSLGFWRFSNGFSGFDSNAPYDPLTLAVFRIDYGVSGVNDRLRVWFNANPATATPNFDRTDNYGTQPITQVIFASSNNFSGSTIDIDEIRIGGTLAEVISGSAAAPRPHQFDFDGDGCDDLAVYRPSVGTWFVRRSQAGFLGQTFGAGEDFIAPADYDGDGKSDIAVFRPSTGTWFRINSSNNQFNGMAFGQSGDLPRPADYDGDGKADIAVFRPSSGTWFLQRSLAGFVGIQFGASGDVPVPADYDGDGQIDLAVYRPSTGTWFTSLNPATNFGAVQFGTAGDKPVPADYDGDGKTDIAVFRPSNGTWYLRQSTGGLTAAVFGLGTDVPVSADYDGDGKSDIAVFRPSSGFWFWLNSSNGAFSAVQFGTNGDRPVPSAFQ